MKSTLKSRIALMFILVCLTALLFGGIVQAKTFNFYVVSHGGPGDSFWGVVMKGMKDAAAVINKGTDDTINAVYSGPAKYSVEELVNMLNSAIATKPDGIVVTITDPAALDAPLRKAIAAGIPVIAINVPDRRPEAERIPYLFYVGGDAVVAIHEIGHMGLETRAKGFIEVMEENGVPVEKIATYLDPTQAIERGKINR